MSSGENAAQSEIPHKTIYVLYPDVHLGLTEKVKGAANRKSLARARAAKANHSQSPTVRFVSDLMDPHETPD